METSTIFKLTSISAVPLNFTNASIAVDDTGVVRGLEKSFVGATGTCRDVGTKCVSSPYPFLAHKLVLLSSQTEAGGRLCPPLTPRCQINESTRLSFLDFSPTLYLDMSYLISHPTRLYGPTHFAFPPYSFIWPFFYEIYIEYPPYSFIRPYSFIWHLRVGTSTSLQSWMSTDEICGKCS